MLLGHNGDSDCSTSTVKGAADRASQWFGKVTQLLGPPYLSSFLQTCPWLLYCQVVSGCALQVSRLTVQGWALLALTWHITAQICNFWGCHLCIDPAAKSWVCIHPSSLHMKGSLFWPCNLTKLGLCRQISPHTYLFSSSRVKPYLSMLQKIPEHAEESW